MKKISLIGFTGVFIGLMVFMIGLITPLPTAMITGVGVGIITLSIMSPCFDFSMTKAMNIIVSVVFYVIGVSLVFIGIITPLSLLVYGLIGVALIIIGITILLKTARRNT